MVETVAKSYDTEVAARCYIDVTNCATEGCGDDEGLTRAFTEVRVKMKLKGGGEMLHGCVIVPNFGWGKGISL